MPSTFPSTAFDCTYDQVTTPEGFHALESEWNDLLQRSYADTIYLTWEYLSTWWEVYGAGHALWILTARDSSQRLVGLAPLSIGPGSGARQLMHELKILGGRCESTSEFLDFMIERGRETEIAAHFMQTIQAGQGPKWNLLSLPLTLADSPAMKVARAALEQWGLPRTREREAPYCSFPETWEKFLQTRSAKFRSTIRNRLKKLHSQHVVELKIGGEDLALDEALLHIIKLNSNRWGTAGEAFHTLKFLEFHRRLIPRLAARGWLALMVLMVDGKAAAGRYDFLYGGKIWGFQGGWDAAYARLSIGTVMNALAFQWAIEKHGVREYDFGAGACRYKSEWSNGTRRLLTTCMAHPHSLSARLLLAARDWHQSRRHPQVDSEESPETADFVLTPEPL